MIRIDAGKCGVFWSLCWLLVWLPIWGVARGLSGAEVEYVRDIKPLLIKCEACHGPLRQQGGLRVDTAKRLRLGGGSGAAIVPGKSSQSLLVDALLGSSGATRMPPEEEGTPLSPAAIDLVRRWIDEGAVAPEETEAVGPDQHWAFQPLRRPVVPEVREAAWGRNAIDQFVQHAREQRGLGHAPEATPETLLRRVYFDLVGLPPEPETMAEFLRDPSATAYESLVDRLLNSPAYGERWGRHWMDVWRYSDWAGYRDEIRESQYHIWRWRDWIVESLNDDKPYDAMIREMLAGDELAPSDPQVLRATGYLGRNWFRFNRHVWLDNTLEHSGKAFLGLTLNCARCHDHKYDPISQPEYYQLRAIFEPYDVRYDRLPGHPDATKVGIARVFDKNPGEPTYLLVRGNEQTPDRDHPLAPALPAFFRSSLTPTPISLPVESYYPALTPFQVEESRGALEQKVALAETELAQLPTTGEAAGRQLAEKRLLAARLEIKSFLARLSAEQAKYRSEAPPVRAEKAREACRVEREAKVATTDWELASAEKEASEAESMLAAKPESGPAKKKVEEAKKKVEAARGAVEAARKNASEGTDPEKYTPLGEVFPDKSTGRRRAYAEWITSGEQPLTPRVAVNHIWLRHFGQALVPTVFDFGLNGQRPSHPELLDWLACELRDAGWRMKHVHRLIVTSATYRQASTQREFAASPDREVASDPDNRFLWRMNPRRLEAEIVRDSLLCVAGSLDRRLGGPEADPADGQTLPRRSLYFRHAKEKEMVFTKLFDGPGVSECYQRGETVVPQQALALANSPLAKSQARGLASRLSASHPSGQDQEFVQGAFRAILARDPTGDESLACREFLERQAELLGTTSQLTTARVGEPGTTAASPDPRQRARENLVLVLFNHHDFVTVR